MKVQIKENIKLLINNNQLKEAKYLIEEYKNITDEDIEIYSLESIVLISGGKYEEAELILKGGLSKDNSNIDLLYNLGYLYEQKNNITEAIATYNVVKILSEEIELIEELDAKLKDLGHMSKEYNVILFGDYKKCIEFKEEFCEWNIVAMYSLKDIKNETSVLELKHHNYDFMFVVEEIDKQEICGDFLNCNNENIYFMEDFKMSVIEGLDYKMADILSKDKIEGIITGLSYAEVGIDEKILPYNFINFALSAQDLYYDFSLVKYLFQFEEVKENLKYVIINLGYYSFDYDMTRTISKYRVHRYINYLNQYNNNKDIIGVDITRVFYERRITFESYINMNKMKQTSVLNRNDENGIYEAKRNSSMDYKHTRDTNEKILEEYLEFLLKNNIKPIVVICPTSFSYRENFNSKKKKVFYRILNKIKRKHDFQTIDYFKCDSFTDEYFWDYSHLNNKGSEKLTKMLNEEIMW